MSKIEDLALKTYPVVMTTLIPADEEHPLIEQDCNKFIREAYIKGYEQAEKDLELSWEDIETIGELRLNVALELRRKELESSTKSPLKFTTEDMCKEVLKRFKERKEK